MSSLSFSIGIMTADAPALSRHLIRLLAAVAVAGRPGWISTKKIAVV